MGRAEEGGQRRMEERAAKGIARGAGGWGGVVKQTKPGLRHMLAAVARNLDATSSNCYRLCARAICFNDDTNMLHRRSHVHQPQTVVSSCVVLRITDHGPNPMTK